MSEAAGTLIREWRQRRNVSQLELANRTGVSTRHVSFVETGRSRPTSTMILRLCDELAVPLREQNRVLLAGGFAPVHPEYGLAEPPMAQVSEAITAILTGHLPYPALVIDQGWDLVDANEAVYTVLDGVAAHLLEPPVNVIRLALHPDGLAPRIVNLAEWTDHLLARLQHEYDATGDARLGTLLEEMRALDTGTAASGRQNGVNGVKSTAGLVVPLQLRREDAVLNLFSTTTVFGTPREVTLSELAIEAFYPADQQTRDLLG